MTEAQTWVVLGVMSATALAFVVMAVIDFISVVRESLRADPGITREESSD